MSRDLDTYKFHTSSTFVILSIAILLSGFSLAHNALGQSKTPVSIVKGASNPSISKPYNPSPLSISVGANVTWTNNDNTGHTVTEGNPTGVTPQNGFDSGILAPRKNIFSCF